MRRRLSLVLLAAALLALLAPAPALAAFGLDEFDVSFTNEDGSAVEQAGSHPFAQTFSLHFNSTPTGKGGELLDEAAKDIIVTTPTGFVGAPTAVQTCPSAQFLTVFRNSGGEDVPACPDSSAIGIAAAKLSVEEATGSLFGAVYNLEPPPGKAAKIGFWIAGEPLPIELTVSGSFPYNITGGPTNISQIIEVVGAQLTLWGIPGDPAHDPLRGHCLSGAGESLGKCTSGGSTQPFLTMPRSCGGPLITDYEADPWADPGSFVKGLAESGAMIGCGRLGFGPEVAANPTTTSAESASGLDFEIDVSDEGLVNPSYEAVADADIEALRMTLPAGVTANPSAAEGLGFCTLGQYELEGLATPAGQGCPDAAKLGTIEAQTPLLENHTLRGSVYLAQPDEAATPGHENPFDSLLALYIVVRDPERGIFVKLAAKVEPDPKTGQLITSVEKMPPFPLSHVDVHLRSGPRAPLITPPTCGTYQTKTLLTPSSGAAPLPADSSFTINSGPNGGPCPLVQPFAPGLSAGTANNAASRYSPFDLRITRRDGEQDLTRFSATLPPGVVGKIAGLAKCPDALIEAAKTKSARSELASPSCPASARIGSVLGGAGVGSELTYVPGSLYLAGPYHGAPLSVVSIVPALAGPFDVGTIVTRVGLNLNPTTAQVEVDGSASDPIPHILKGIPLKVRELRVMTDRPGFTLNSTGCKAKQTAASFGGSGADPFLAADDTIAAALARYQASSCASLGFKPKLSLKLKGGTKRSKHPALHSTVTYPYPSGPGYSNISKAVVTLPPTEFIDNAHINNPCTRVQFNANTCPPSSILGTAKAISPLLDEPLEGPVYFRSNGGERNIPDVVADLHGLVHIVLVGFVDTATPKTNPRIRTTFQNVPDAAVQSFTLNLKGGNKGLLVNSANLCKKKQHATIELTGQNGKAYDTQPVVKTSCKGKKP
jgi:hypothetical protein